MNKKYRKEYFEIYANLTLKRYWEGYKDGFINLDKPDLQNKKFSIGIEVVRALDELDGELLAIFNNKSMLIEEKIEYFEKKNIKFDIDENDILKVSSGWYDTNKNDLKIKKTFLNKLEKLDKDYMIFSTNALYIFTGTKLIGDIEILVNDLHTISLKYKNIFNIVFLNCIDVLYIIEGLNILKVCMDDDDIEQIEREASVYN